MKKPTITVVGSSNTDLVVQVTKFPTPGETVLGDRFLMARGGKGANQAVAAARLGADVTLISRLGKDSFGEMALAAYQAEKIDTSYIRFDEETPSGVALIMVDDQGENVIAVAGGANNKLSSDDLLAAEEAIASADYVLVQLEIPLPTVETAVMLANKHQVPVILNPAPAQPLPKKLLESIDILTPNETEAAILGLFDSAQPESQMMDQMTGTQTIVMTMGRKGALLITGELQQKIIAYPIDVVDSTAAGDAFNGALSVALANGRSLVDAVQFANAAGALTTTKPGAQTSLPTLAEVEAFLAN